MRPTVAMMLLFGFLSLPSLALADNGLVTKKSAYGVPETLDRLEKILQTKGLTIFARIDHTAGAQKVEQTLRPTQVLIFGNPKMGTPLMASQQTIGIDLPMKALVWEDGEGQVWLAYNRPQYLADRHGVNNEAVIGKMTNALNGLTDKATQRE
ncbi:MAG: DUF302 domain-containing protein [Gammaproteobacteria bacterium]|nr:DUF302 domain-containing protein [Gammaproteobacteria bacterium]